jgi:ethanolamine utilization microcompartment shell protein EutL
MSLVDSASVEAPEAATSSTSDEYTPRAQQILFQAFKPGASHGTQLNAGNVYIIRKGDGTGSANRDDMGDIVATLTPGQTFVLASAPLDRNVFSPYRYLVDADNANDGVFVVLLIQ